MRQEIPDIRNSQEGNTSNFITVQKITAVWGFAESVLGGVLHILRIPFTGLFIGSFAVTCIYLIAHYSKKPSTILRATMIVILIKAVVSPYSPLTAYFAVSLQGLLGFMFFSIIKIERIAVSLLGITALLFSAIQKIFILTILFGTTLWKSIDIFYKYLINELGVLDKIFPAQISIYLIIFYCGIHAVAGLLVGLKAAGIPKWIALKSKSFHDDNLQTKSEFDLFEKKKSHKKKRWWQRKSGIFIISLLLVLMIASYFTPQLQKENSYDIFFMIIRSFAITFIWFYILGPFIIKIFKGIIEKKKSAYTAEIEEAINLFPEIKRILNYSWQISYRHKGWIRIKNFFSNAVSLLLFYELLNE